MPGVKRDQTAKARREARAKRLAAAQERARSKKRNKKNNCKKRKVKKESLVAAVPPVERSTIKIEKRGLHHTFTVASREQDIAGSAYVRGFDDCLAWLRSLAYRQVNDDEADEYCATNLHAFLQQGIP